MNRCYKEYIEQFIFIFHNIELAQNQSSLYHNIIIISRK